MNKTEFAAMITGREYGDEITSNEAAIASRDGLVVIYGASDDLTEFAGAISDEAGACDGAVHLLDRNGIIPDYETLDHDDEKEMRAYFKRKDTGAVKVEALWCKEPGYSWTFKTKLPHATFEIVEGDRKYCRGIVIEIKDLPA